MVNSAGDQAMWREFPLSVVFGTLTVVLLLAVVACADKPKKRPKLRAVPFAISKETTRITKPLRPDGYVDYVKALNQAMSKGVTPKNNAAVLIVRAIGPRADGEPIPKRFFKELGIDPLPEKGEYFIDLYKFFPTLDPAPKEGEEDKFFDAHDAAVARPWTEKEHPLIARWLTKNAVSLRLAVEASKRSHFYEPYVGSDDGDPLLTMTFTPGLSASRSLIRALRARAMLHAGHARIDAAWKDIMACHRLARLYAKQPTLINYIVGIALDAMATESSASLARHGKLTAKQLKRMSADLRKLPPNAGLAERFNVAERYFALDTACVIARGEAGRLESLFEFSIFQTPFEIRALPYLPRLLVDWDHILAAIQRRYDDLVKAVRQPTRAKRLASVKLFDEQSAQKLKDVRDPKLLIMRFFTRSPRRFISESIANTYVAWMFSMNTAMLSAEDRGRVRLALARVTVALAAYHVDRRAYPKKLSELSPKYLAKVPRDLFADGDFHYQVTKDGYLLYSVGPNGRDDGGQGWHIEYYEGDGDDIVLGR